MRLIIFFTFFLVITSCSKDKNKKNHNVVNIHDIEQQEILRSQEIIKSKILDSGDVESYNQVYQNYFKKGKTNEMLIYSLIMANEFKNEKATFDVFEILYLTGHYKNKDCYDYNLDCLDEDTKELAIHYLKLAINRGSYGASSVLLTFYDENKYYPIKELYNDTVLIKKAKKNIIVK